MAVKVAVIGAGVTGLSAALRLLQDLGDAVEVTVVARDFPAPAETFFADPQAAINYTTPWGGAHNRWVLWVPDGSPAAAVAARDHGFALATYRHMQKTLARYPEAGITFLPALEYLEAPGPEYTRLRDPAVQRQLGFHDADLGLGFRVLDEAELPPVTAVSTGNLGRVTLGVAYRSWCVNPMVYCSFLMRRISALGGRISKRELRSPAELFAAGYGLVVNCSGNGFGDDPHMFITRGQTCLVRNTCDATVTRQNADGSWTFSVPRFFDGGTIIGGTKEPDNWDATPSPATRERLLANFAATYPPVLGARGAFDVVADVVGRRPTRHGGMRLEPETVTESAGFPSGVVVHAYGAGGRGFEISWGVAGAVTDMVREQLQKTGPLKAAL